MHMLFVNKYKQKKAQLARQYHSEIMTICIFARILSLCTHICALYSTVYG